MVPKPEYARLVSRTPDVLSEKLVSIPLTGEVDLTCFLIIFEGKTSSEGCMSSNSG
jgi:hypothetical protein